MKPYPTIRVTGTAETSKLGAGGAGALLYTIAPTAVGKTAVITLAGIQWCYMIAPAADKELIVQVNTFANTLLRIGTRRAGPDVVYFDPAWEIVLVKTEAAAPALTIQLDDAGGGNGNFYLNLLGYNFREFDT